MKEFYSNDIKICIDLPVLEILDVAIVQKINEHSTAMLKLILDNKKIKNMEKLMTGDKEVRIYKVEENKDKILFQGCEEEYESTVEDGLWILKVVVVANTIQLDREKKSRTYQIKKMTYKKLAKKILRDYSGILEWKIEKDQDLSEFYLQYNETDWNFLKRVISKMNSFIFSDCTSAGVLIKVGISNNNKYAIDDVSYETRTYVKGDKKSVVYILKRYDNWEIGDSIEFINKKLIITNKIVHFTNSELTFRYELTEKRFLICDEIIPDFLLGLVLQGEISRVKTDEVYVKFDIDGLSGEASYAFGWKPEQSNLLHCMPECGEKVSVRIVDEIGTKAIAFQCIRKNGGLSSQLSMKENRQFVTNCNKIWEMFAEEIRIVDKENLYLKLSDNKGFDLKSSGKITLKADGNVMAISKQIQIIAKQKIAARTNKSSFEICKDFNLFSKDGIKQIGEKKADQIQQNKHKASIRGNFWKGFYNSIQSIPYMGVIKNQDIQVYNELVALLPKIGGGKEIYSLYEVMQDKDELTFPKSMKSLKAETTTGGYMIP